MIVVPDAENRTIVSSSVWTERRNVTDRQPVAITAVCIASSADF